ncbi:NAD(P)H-hydrate dehydratase [Streptococcus ovuberis]|uniref:ADP-dependent (S)-NAD(P)H-hydrate dehydratase n=1 Tax=Streptococcus ovuberis TaxID=1936207 RepID=A0A7X6S0Q1_9STRE|nr:NAD(P)H-hydrate dehydratase [Streptococcus ovuberis]NKZ20329.1 NAD(P)H-hydrate dehydratase [Streptococcus ovuberis]
MAIDQRLLEKVIRPRPLDSHKGTFGRVLLIGGLYPYGGAIILATLACVHSGAGLVMVATDKENIVALHARLPEAMAFDVRDRALLVEQMQLADVILIGPGLGEELLAQHLFKEVLSYIGSHQILLVDGSGLNLLAKSSQQLPECQSLILTPHQKEWERLSGVTIEQQSETAPQKALQKFPARTILVAKSHRTSVHSLGRESLTLDVGGPHQATGGMGDTLAGMIAGFVAQFQDDLFETVAVATHLHSAIADRLAQEAYVVLPSQISLEVSKAMKDIEKKN